MSPKDTSADRVLIKMGEDYVVDITCIDEPLTEENQIELGRVVQEWLEEQGRNFSVDSNS